MNSVQLKKKNLLTNNSQKRFFLGIYRYFDSFSFSLNSTIDISLRVVFKIECSLLFE